MFVSVRARSPALHTVYATTQDAVTFSINTFDSHFEWIILENIIAMSKKQL